MNCLFEEKQKFTQWWVWTLLFLTLFVLDKNTYTVFIGGVIILFFYLLELRIKVTEEALYYQFFPLHLKPFSIKKKQIEKISHSLKSNNYTMIPLNLHFNKKGFLKVELSISKGRKKADLREYKKQQDWKREKARLEKK